MMTLSAFNSTSLHAQLACHSRGIKNVMNSCSLGTYTKLAKTNSSPAVRRQRLQIQMLKGVPDVAGFGSQRAGGKAKHRLLTLDLTKVEEVQKFNLFARKFTKDELASKWEPIGEILIEKETNLELALKERRKKLLAAAQHQYPSFMMLKTGEEVQYGYRKAGEEKNENEEKNESDITLVDVRGRELDSSIPALLRVDDGVKPPPKRY